MAEVYNWQLDRTMPYLYAEAHPQKQFTAYIGVPGAALFAMDRIKSSREPVRHDASSRTRDSMGSVRDATSKEVTA